MAEEQSKSTETDKTNETGAANKKTATAKEPLTLAEKLANLPAIVTTEDSLANYWDEEPAVYEQEFNENGVKRTVIQFLPPTSVTKRDKMRRDIYREHFAELNKRERQNAVERQDAEIKQLNMTKEQAEDYRARYFVWEIPAPEAMGVISDSRVTNRTAVQPKLPAGTRKINT